MESTRKFSLTMVFLLAFLIIASSLKPTDIRMESQGRRMAHGVVPPSCKSDGDCKNYKCPPSLPFPYCDHDKCGCGN
ncbi:hypothetical protein MtrunA17_Chr4g0018841 [Medicago truncatula]|uniref:Defensin-like protein n=2 Tax=Medicago truncatula TaxID=3880 RepID=A0A072TFP3_MEDTR|nr:Defensin-like protein [Medicago truncatula]KEH15803.1 Defensin-like protein [Medicago truncatula]RHN59864.1 hypothetical protein MtrunA17_Chr4g0018841 [Medicago truncatula]